MIDFFLMSKYKPIEENILYTSKILYELLEKSRHIDELFEEYAKCQGVELSLNLERMLYLSLCFLFSIEKIALKNNVIKRV